VAGVLTAGSNGAPLIVQPGHAVHVVVP